MTFLLIANQSTLLEQFLKLFLEFNVIALELLLMGLLLVVFDFDKSSDKRLSIIGYLFIIAGFVLRVIDDSTFFMSFVLVLLICAVLMLSFVAVTLKSKKAWFIKASTLSVNLEISDSSVSYSFLVGSEGETITDINPQGHICIKDINFFVTSNKAKTIQRGKRVVVLSVERDRIFVEELIPEDVV
ncbi:MAG: hypothetical protein LBU60_02905 [Clostridiales bacterium]|jgi:membrane-bound ClpP family serine protease|nr:hypothetical protein [Clostridiales bacterium]